ncbi:ArsR/SmtB family transcription factor [Amycolatopsis alkalitolerans]|uniref:Winged helix-turn-helix transcriptional regulator n=1 Tax=Amycolatopsis alkalitolerans TaxID=2547244 RepID=A0A5C4LSD9_9PSEU|nr:metalloregulator ArsR/SmtB family transcription factor [Amycolatopsis alkalitolerans]TNC19401.1 winged helix-turn-helix transcriptional regulator [Amycolatopsis alkalitolerans]
MASDIDEALWAAIGDPTRLRVLDLLLTRGPGTASGLSRELPVTRQAVAKHLAILERNGLVSPEPVGREMRYAVNPDQFARACAQVARVSRAWDLRLRRIKAIAETAQRSRDQKGGEGTEK